MKTSLFCSKEIQAAAFEYKQHRSSIKSATAPEIEITPGMINAGVKEFRSFRRDETCTTEIVRAVYSAMHKKFLLDHEARHATKCRQHSAELSSRSLVDPLIRFSADEK